MFAKISLTAAFLLMTAPPLACASTGDAANHARITCTAQESQAVIVVAQDTEQSPGTVENGADSDNDNNSDSNDNADANQNADGNQMDQQDAAGNDQPVAPQVLNGPENDPDSSPQFNESPQPVNPYQ